MAWLRIQKAATYVDVSPRTIRRWLREGLRHSRIGGIPYISEQAMDDWMRAHEATTSKVDRIVAEVLSEI